VLYTFKYFVIIFVHFINEFACRWIEVVVAVDVMILLWVHSPLDLLSVAYDPISKNNGRLEVKVHTFLA
jgi:hypothetical protein